MIQGKVVIVNETGLHARPASELVKIASSFVASVKVLVEGREADAKSIINILSLGLRQSDEITLQTDGIDEQDAFNTVKALIESGFGDE